MFGLFVFSFASVALAEESEDLLAELSNLLVREELATHFNALLHSCDLVYNDIRGILTLDGLDEHLKEGSGHIHS
jgi:hypothetical protein